MARHQPAGKPTVDLAMSFPLPSQPPPREGGEEGPGHLPYDGLDSLFGGPAAVDEAQRRQARAQLAAKRKAATTSLAETPGAPSTVHGAGPSATTRPGSSRAPRAPPSVSLRSFADSAEGARAGSRGLGGAARWSLGASQDSAFLSEARLAPFGSPRGQGGRAGEASPDAGMARSVSATLHGSPAALDASPRLGTSHSAGLLRGWQRAAAGGSWDANGGGGAGALVASLLASLPPSPAVQARLQAQQAWPDTPTMAGSRPSSSAGSSMAGGAGANGRSSRRRPRPLTHSPARTPSAPGAGTAAKLGYGAGAASPPTSQAASGHAGQPGGQPSPAIETADSEQASPARASPAANDSALARPTSPPASELPLSLSPAGIRSSREAGGLARGSSAGGGLAGNGPAPAPHSPAASRRAGGTSPRGRGPGSLSGSARLAGVSFGPSVNQQPPQHGAAPATGLAVRRRGVAAASSPASSRILPTAEHLDRRRQPRLRSTETAHASGARSAGTSPARRRSSGHARRSRGSTSPNPGSPPATLQVLARHRDLAAAARRLLEDPTPPRRSRSTEASSARTRAAASGTGSPPTTAQARKGPPGRASSAARLRSRPQVSDPFRGKLAPFRPLAVSAVRDGPERGFSDAADAMTAPADGPPSPAPGNQAPPGPQAQQLPAPPPPTYSQGPQSASEAAALSPPRLDHPSAAGSTSGPLAGPASEVLPGRSREPSALANEDPSGAGTSATSPSRTLRGVASVAASRPDRSTRGGALTPAGQADDLSGRANAAPGPEPEQAPAWTEEMLQRADGTRVLVRLLEALPSESALLGKTVTARPAPARASSPDGASTPAADKRQGKHDLDSALPRGPDCAPSGPPSRAESEDSLDEVGGLATEEHAGAMPELQAAAMSKPVPELARAPPSAAAAAQPGTPPAMAAPPESARSAVTRDSPAPAVSEQSAADQARGPSSTVGSSAAEAASDPAEAPPARAGSASAPASTSASPARLPLDTAIASQGASVSAASDGPVDRQSGDRPERDTVTDCPGEDDEAKDDEAKDDEAKVDEAEDDEAEDSALDAYQAARRAALPASPPSARAALRAAGISSSAGSSAAASPLRGAVPFVAMLARPLSPSPQSGASSPPEPASSPAPGTDDPAAAAREGAPRRWQPRVPQPGAGSVTDVPLVRSRARRPSPPAQAALPLLTDDTARIRASPPSRRPPPRPTDMPVVDELEADGSAWTSRRHRQPAPGVITDDDVALAAALGEPPTPSKPAALPSPGRSASPAQPQPLGSRAAGRSGSASDGLAQSSPAASAAWSLAPSSGGRAAAGEPLPLVASPPPTPPAEQAAQRDAAGGTAVPPPPSHAPPAAPPLQPWHGAAGSALAACPDSPGPGSRSRALAAAQLAVLGREAGHAATRAASMLDPRALGLWLRAQSTALVSVSADVKALCAAVRTATLELDAASDESGLQGQMMSEGRQLATRASRRPGAAAAAGSAVGAGFGPAGAAGSAAAAAVSVASIAESSAAGVASADLQRLRACALAATRSLGEARQAPSATSTDRELAESRAAWAALVRHLATESAAARSQLTAARAAASADSADLERRLAAQRTALSALRSAAKEAAAIFPAVRHVVATGESGPASLARCRRLAALLGSKARAEVTNEGADHRPTLPSASSGEGFDDEAPAPGSAAWQEAVAAAEEAARAEQRSRFEPAVAAEAARWTALAARVASAESESLAKALAGGGITNSSPSSRPSFRVAGGDAGSTAPRRSTYVQRASDRVLVAKALLAVRKLLGGGSTVRHAISVGRGLLGARAAAPVPDWLAATLSGVEQSLEGANGHQGPTEQTPSVSEGSATSLGPSDGGTAEHQPGPVEPSASSEDHFASRHPDQAGTLPSSRPSNASPEGPALSESPQSRGYSPERLVFRTASAASARGSLPRRTDRLPRSDPPVHAAAVEAGPAEPHELDTLASTPASEDSAARRSRLALTWGPKSAAAAEQRDAFPSVLSRRLPRDHKRYLVGQPSGDARDAPCDEKGSDIASLGEVDSLDDDFDGLMRDMEF